MRSERSFPFRHVYDLLSQLDGPCRQKKAAFFVNAYSSSASVQAKSRQTAAACAVFLSASPTAGRHTEEG